MNKHSVINKKGMLK